MTEENRPWWELRFPRKSIAGNFTLSLSVILVLFFLAIISFSYLRGRDLLWAQSERKADDYISTLTEMLTIPLWTYDRASIEHIGSTFSHYEALDDITIKDIAGNVLFEKRSPNLNGEYLYRRTDVHYRGQNLGSIELRFSLREYQTNLKQVLNMALVFLFGAVSLVLFATGVLLERFLALPMAKLQARMEQIARGDYTLPISQDQPVELQKIAMSFEHMASEIKSREASLRLAQFSIDNAADSILWVDVSGNIIYANESSCQLLGYSAQEILAMSIFDVHPTVTLASWQQYLDRLREAKTSHVEVNFRTRSAELIPVEGVVNHLEYEEAEYVFAFCRDIRPRKQGELALAQERALLRTVIDNLPDAIYAKDLQGRKTLGNLADLENIGAQSEAEVLGKSDFEIYPHNLASEYAIEDRDILRSGQPLINQERQVLDAHGRMHWFLNTKLPLRDVHNNIIGIIGIAHDITESKQINQALREREEMLHTLINAMPDIVCFKDGEGRWVESNEYTLKLFEMEDLPYRGMKDAELAEYRPFYQAAFLASQESDERAWQAHNLSRCEETVHRSDGSTLVFDIIKVPLFHLNASRKGLVVIGRDITESKRSESALRESEERNRALLNAIPDLIFVFDRDGSFLDYHASDASLLAYPPQEFLGKNIREIFPNLAEEVSRLFDIVLREGGLESMEYALSIGKQTQFFEMRIVGFGENRILTIVRDITDRKMAEEELRQRNVEIGLLYEAGWQLSRTLELDVIYETLFRLTAEIMDCDGLLVSSFSSVDGLLRCEYARLGIQILDLGSIPPTPLANEGEGLQSQVIRSGKSLLVRDYSEHININYGAEDVAEEARKVKSALIVPLLAEGNVQGVIQVFSYQRNAYNSNHLRIFEVIASHVAIASANASLYRQAQEEIAERQRAETALAQERTLLRTLIEHLPDGIYTMDLQGRKTLANRADLNYMGAQSEIDVLGKTDLEWFAEPLASSYYEDDMYVIHTGQAVINREEETIDIFGRHRWILTSKLPLRNQNGEIIGLVGIGRDLTERKEAENALRENERLLRKVLDLVSHHINALNAQGEFLLANVATATSFDMMPEELLGRKLVDLDKNSAETKQYLQDNLQVLESNEPLFIPEEPFTDRFGILHWHQTTKVPIEIGGQKAVLCVAIDITEHKLAEQALRESEQKYRSLFETMEQGVVYQDAQGRIFSVNPAAARIFGLAQEQMLGVLAIDPPWKCIHEDGSLFPSHQQPTALSLRTGKPVREAVLGVFVPSRNDYRWLVVSSVPQFHADEEKPYQVYATITDVTELKRAEDALRRRLKQEELISTLSTLFIEVSYEEIDNEIQTSLHVLAEHLKAEQVIVFLFSADLKKVSHFFAWHAQGLQHYTQITDISLTKYRWFTERIKHLDVLHISTIDEIPSQAVAEREIWQSLGLKSHLGTPLVIGKTLIGYLAVLSKQVERRWNEDDVSLLKSVGWIFANALERKRSEQALHESEERYRVLFEQMLDAFVLHEIVYDESGQPVDYRYLDVNPAFEKATGLSRKQLVGNTVLKVQPQTELHWVDAYNEVAVKGIPQHFERFAQDIGKFYEVVVYKPHAHQFAVIFSDVSERRQIEEQIRMLNVELERRVSERTSQLEAANRELEAFSYSVSHDLRTPLRSIDGFSQALQEDYAEVLDRRGANYLNRIRSASQHMANLIEDLLKLSRITRCEIRRVPIDLSKLAYEIMDDLLAVQPERRIEFISPPELVVEADPNLMRIVLTNLLGNACKFTSKHSQAVIELGVTINEGNAVYFVRDDGAGFDMAYAGKLFGAFQRLHTPTEFEGTGIGLAIVQRVIQRHAGKIWAEGAPEQGAVFYFTL